MMWLYLATTHDLTTAHIVISSSNLFLGFHNLIKFLIFLSFLKQNTVSIQFSGKKQTFNYFKVISVFLNLWLIMMTEVFYQNISMRKAIIKKITCSFLSLRITNLDFTLETSQTDKKVHNFPCYQKKYHYKRGELKVGKIPSELLGIAFLAQVKHQITWFEVFTLGIKRAYLKFSQSGDKREAKTQSIVEI